jgi:hypothetical protein
VDAANFAATCPGGVAPKGSAPELAQHCRTTLAHSSKQGIIVSLCFYAWAGATTRWPRSAWSST